MEKIINISGKDVKMACTAGTLYRYRTQFKRDLTKDIMKLEQSLKVVKGSEEEFTAVDLELFENIAWAMAKTADNSTPPIENWLDSFDTFSIYQVLPDIFEMLSSNFVGLGADEKKVVAPIEVQQQ